MKKFLSLLLLIGVVGCSQDHKIFECATDVKIYSGSTSRMVLEIDRPNKVMYFDGQKYDEEFTESETFTKGYIQAKQTLLDSYGYILEKGEKGTTDKRFDYRDQLRFNKENFDVREVIPAPERWDKHADGYMGNRYYYYSCTPGLKYTLIPIKVIEDGVCVENCGDSKYAE